MQSQWFVIHTLSGQEQKVKDSIEKRLKAEEMGEFIKEVLVPMEKVAEVRGGKKTVTHAQAASWLRLHRHGLAWMKTSGVLDKPWYFIRETPGIIGFVGGERPIPVTPDEIAVIKAQCRSPRTRSARRSIFEVGETIKINDGPFLNFSGVIEEIEPERGKLKVTVNIFGRNTPVELEYWQVEKA